MSLISETPRAPWLRRVDWASNRCDGQIKRFGAGAKLVTVIWGIPTLGVCLLALLGLLQGSYFFIGLALPFVAIEIVLVMYSLRAGIRFHTFGNPSLILERVPVPLGGTLRGEIVLEPSAPTTALYTLNFRCIQRPKSYNGESSSLSVPWQSEQVLVPLPGGRLPISFLVPQNQSPTYSLDGRFGTSWELRISAAGERVPFRTVYQIPVFDVPLGPDDDRDVQAAQVETLAKVQAYQQPGESRIHVNALASGKTEFFFEPNRAPVLTAQWITVVVITGILVFVFELMTGTPTAHVSFWLPSLGFLFGAIFFFLACGNLFATKRVTIGSGQMMIEDTWGKIPMGSTTIPASDVVAIRPRINITAFNGIPYTRLVVECLDGTAIAGSQISDPKEAEWLAWRMSQLLGK